MLLRPLRSPGALLAGAGAAILAVSLLIGSAPRGYIVLDQDEMALSRGGNPAQSLGQLSCATLTKLPVCAGVGGGCTVCGVTNYTSTIPGTGGYDTGKGSGTCGFRYSGVCNGRFVCANLVGPGAACGTPPSSPTIQ